MTTYLVADDSLFARMLVKDAVKQIDEDAEFIESASGAGVLESVEAGKHVDYFLLDINMEPPNGVDTASKLLELGQEKSRITLITGNKSLDLQEQAKTLGISYINKAISPTDVEAFVTRLKQFFDGGQQ